MTMKRAQERPAGERLHALDAARAGALLLGVAFHASMSFLPDPQIWIVRDDQSAALGGLFYISHIFRMTLFFLLAGFFARMMLHRRGVAGFIGNRVKRIALPLLIFWPFVFAGIVACLIWGYVASVGPEAAAAAPPPAPMTAKTFPLTHLWFLYVLIIFYAAALALRGVVVAVDRKGGWRGVADGFVAPIVEQPLGFLALAAPAATALFLMHDWYLWFGVPTPDTGLVPNRPALIAYGVAFGFGWLLQRQPRLLETLQKRWALNLALAIALTAGLIAYAGLAPVLTPAPQDWKKAAYAAVYGSAVWTWTFGLVGAAMRFLSAPNPAIRYAADASYWVYIVHVPVVMALQVLAFGVDAPWTVKFPAVLLLTYAATFLSYDLLVRYSFVGALLNGKKTRKKKTRGANPAFAATAAE
ncbi:MAG: acyltransferase family protein [Pseudomonadota bacterium]|nr:acyltransferase family protein [Pseudomonadota bacterium]